MRVIAAQGVHHAVLVFPATLERVMTMSKELGFMIEPMADDPKQVCAVKDLRTG